jgi:hypothetical protein
MTLGAQLDMGRKQKTRKMEAEQALAIWKTPELTVKQAVKKMKGWTPSAAYRWLGRRGLPPGPKSL